MNKHYQTNFQKRNERRENKAINLFNNLKDYFYGEEFSLQDVQEAFNILSDIKNNYNNFTKKDLNYLVEQGFLEYNKSTKLYYINIELNGSYEDLIENTKEEYNKIIRIIRID